MHAAYDIALGVALAPAAAAGALQDSAQAPAAPAGAGRAPAAGATGAADVGAPATTSAAQPHAAAPAGIATATPAARTAPFVPAPAPRATSGHVGATPAFGQAPSAAGTVGGTVFALVFVVGLILALAWLARRMPGVAGGSHRALRVVASLPLGPREKVVVVDVGGQQLLLGVGAGGTRALHALAAPLPEAERAATPAFAQLLAQHFGKKA